MQSQNECKSCGNIYESNIKRCAYCGSFNPNFKEKIVERNIFDDLKSSFNPQPSTSRSTSSHSSKSNINVCILIFLIIVFWPAAVIYAIVQSQNK